GVVDLGDSQSVVWRLYLAVVGGEAVGEPGAAVVVLVLSVAPLAGVGVDRGGAVDGGRGDREARGAGPVGRVGEGHGAGDVGVFEIGRASCREGAGVVDGGGARAEELRVDVDVVVAAAAGE